MNRTFLSALLVALGVFFHAAQVAAAVQAHTEMALTSGWHITQDTRVLGEVDKWYEPQFAADWQPIDRLAHLQLLC